MARQPLAPPRGAEPFPTLDAARSAGHPRLTWRARARSGWRALAAPQVWGGRLPPASATLNGQFWADAAPWRLTAGWVVAAGLLAGGALQRWQALNWQQILLLWLLGDLLWGALWRLAGGRNAVLGLRAGGGEAALRLPYLQPTSPAAQLLSLDTNNSLPYLMRVALPTLLLTLIVTAVLGLPALLCTSALALVTVGGWILRRTLQTPPLLLHAVALVLLPWLLTLLQIGARPAAAGWGMALALGLIWTLHAWGEARVAVWQSDTPALWLLGGAQVALVLLLVLNKTPVWTPIVLILLLPTWLRTLRGQPLAGLSGWWMAAFVVGALALGWG